MWVFTKDGFYSAVKSETISEDQIMVRARKHDDLRKLVAQLGVKAKILTTNYADYKFRVILSQEEWATYLAKSAFDIDYTNFKDVACAGDYERHEVYMDVWASLFAWQNRMYGRAKDYMRRLYAGEMKRQRKGLVR